MTVYDHDESKDNDRHDENVASELSRYRRYDEREIRRRVKPGGMSEPPAEPLGTPAQEVLRFFVPGGWVYSALSSLSQSKVYRWFYASSMGEEDRALRVAEAGLEGIEWALEVAAEELDAARRQPPNPWEPAPVAEWTQRIHDLRFYKFIAEGWLGRLTGN